MFAGKIKVLCGPHVARGPDVTQTWIISLFSYVTQCLGKTTVGEKKTEGKNKERLIRISFEKTNLKANRI